MYILIKPLTWLDKAKLAILGIAPSIFCDRVQYGPGMVECVLENENSCIAIKMEDVMRVIWDTGYNEAVEEAKDNYFKMQEEMISARFPTIVPPNNEKSESDVGVA